MSKIKLTGSNSGYVELDSAADAGNLTLTLPTSGARLLSNTDNVFSGITTTAELDINGKIDVSTDIVGGRNLKVTGITTLSDDLTLTGASYNVVWDKSDNQLEFGDNAKISFGGQADMRLFHDGTNSIITNATGDLYINNNADTIIKPANDCFIKPQDGENGISVIGNGAVELYFNNSKKIETTNTGAVVTGICTATSFSGSGEGLTRTTQLSHRNALINGEMLVSQRGTSEASVSSTGYKNAPDRWQFYAYPSGQSGVYTVSQLAGAPNGFQKSYRVNCTTADTSLQADSGVILRQTIEEQNLQHFRKGYSDARQMTLSFNVKTTKTGTYVCELYDMRNIRHVSATYTVSDTNWNRYTITFPADTSGQFSAGSNGGGMIVHWWLVAGTNYQSGSLATSWTANTSANRAVGQLNFADSTSNIFDLTGCQLEAGPVATPYEHRTFHDYLHACKRYFQFVPPTLGEAQHSTNIQGCLTASPPMRAAPTCAIKVTSNNINLAGSGPKTCSSVGTLYYNSTQGGWAEMGGSSFSQYRNYYILPNCFTFSSEI